METISVKIIGPCTLRSRYPIACSDCGHTSHKANEFMKVVKILPNETEKEVYMCHDCVESYD